MFKGNNLIKNLIYYTAKLTLSLSRNIPLSWNLYLGSLIGRIAYYILRRERVKTMANLQLALGNEKSREELTRIARNVFVNLGKNLFELFWASKTNSRHLKEIVKVEGIEYLQEGFTRGKGLIVITPHLGNWEFMAQYASMAGFPVNVIAKEVYDPRLNNLLLHIRKNQGVRTIFRDEPSAGKKILQALKRGEILGMLIDQDTKVEGVYVKFFNQFCYTPTGAAILAMRTGAQVIFGTISRNSKEKHIIRFYPPLKTVYTSNKQQDVITNTQLYTNLIEASIRQFPDQWVWMHQRWKTKPINGEHILN